MAYNRPQHDTIVQALQGMNGDLLSRAKCYFGGGTAIVLRNGEYRLSLDVDFLCADVDGYRELRNVIHDGGLGTIFGDKVEVLRKISTDQYGIRAVVAMNGQPIKFEIVREGRIPLDGATDPEFGVPLLSVTSQFAEKLLANADRCLDKAVAYRDAIDLGMLVETYGSIPAEAAQIAERAYGATVSKNIGNVMARLADATEAAKAADALQMEIEDFNHAARNLRAAALERWPSGELAELPAPRTANPWDHG